MSIACDRRLTAKKKKINRNKEPQQIAPWQNGNNAAMIYVQDTLQRKKEIIPKK